MTMKNDTPIRVLYILDSLKQRFGVTSVALNYYNNIDSSRVIIDFLVYDDSEMEIVDRIMKNGSNVFFMPRLSLKNVHEFRKFFDVFFKEHIEYSIVHSHFNQIDSIVFPIAKRNGIKCCISHSHNTKYSDYKIRAIRNFLMCLPIKKYADIWAACGIEAGQFLYGKKFLESDKHLIINNAVKLENFVFNETIRDKKRNELELNGKVVIGNVGSLKIQKNQQFLLKLFAEIIEKDKNTEYRLLIVGDGPLRNELENYAKQLKIDKQVIFTGTRKDVNELLMAMDIFLLPSLYEGLPVIGIEAQAAGLPCIFSDTITREVDICNVAFIDLHCDLLRWIEKVKEYKTFVRKKCSKEVEERGFSIVLEAEKLCNKYEDLSMR